ncbi:MAG: MerR family transcriptional regulator [Acidobacteriia bacterium]|nr:MerR family transcriptional regulator [Terriglobia bacterium]
MFSVTQLARACGLSRTAVLYYESLGLLPAPPRSRGNYRQYGERHLNRLRQICSYRSAGLNLADVRTLLGEPKRAEAAAVLQRRLAEIGLEVERLKEHQRAILRLLEHRATFVRRKDMDKEKWVAIMKAAGFAEKDMRKWHQEFERAAPEDHQEFLEYLKIPKAEIERIRVWSREAA